jgi:hypothetical protein
VPRPRLGSGVQGQAGGVGGLQFYLEERLGLQSSGAYKLGGAVECVRVVVVGLGYWGPTSCG